MACPNQSYVLVPGPLGDRFCELVAKADAGDKEALAEVRGILDRQPKIWRQVADLASRAQSAFINLISSRSVTLSESLRRQVAQMKAELEGERPAPLERHIIVRIVACWLQIAFAESACAQHADDAEAGYWQKRTDQAQRRYLAAVKALATIRKLLPDERPG